MAFISTNSCKSVKKINKYTTAWTNLNILISHHAECTNYRILCKAMIQVKTSYYKQVPYNKIHNIEKKSRHCSASFV